MTIEWGSYDGSDLPALARLATACLEADGGLPQFGDGPLLKARMLGGETLAARDEAGELVGAAHVAVRDHAATTTGLVLPTRRGEGLGNHLFQWVLERAGSRSLTVATETCSPDAEALYARFGLSEVFSELVMRHPLGDVPAVPVPEGVGLVAVAKAEPDDLFAAYVGSFADRPGFPNPTQDEWLEELEDDPDWRRDLSSVALDAAGEPVGFVNVLDNWIDQVGVVPAWRGRRLGAHLVSEALRALADGGADAAWLTVNTDNPAAGLYRGLGFEDRGKRGRFERTAG